MQFLSPEWLDALDGAVRASQIELPPTRLGVGQIVTGTPFGEVRYTVVLGDNSAEVVQGSTDDAQVTIVADYATACAIASGSSVAELLYAGQLKVRGDATVLLSAQELLTTLSGGLAELASTTSFAAAPN